MNAQFEQGYLRAKIVHTGDHAVMSPPEWFAHPQNRPSPGDSAEFHAGYIKRVSEIAETEGWTPIWPD